MTWVRSGLSPQVRGTARSPRFPAAIHRFIPAGAGNRSRKATSGVSDAVYPRRCGEQKAFGLPTAQAHGLSPQVRGTAAPDRGQVFAHRFIPAGAGNSGRPVARLDSMAVYPRRCGEQDIKMHLYSGNYGLSPQVRGTECIRQPHGAGPRFIPAGAGNRPLCGRFGRPWTVYPRRCGEQFAPVRLPAPGFRFIPAGAGNSLNVHDCFIRKNREPDFPPNILYEF